MNPRTVSAFGAVIFSGLFAGFLLTVLVIELTLRGHDSAVYTQVRHVELEHLDQLATALLLPAIVAATVFARTVFRRRSGRWTAAVAVVSLLVVLLISLSISVPINTEQLGWSTVTPPVDWSAIRDRWQLAHTVRTAAAALAFALLTMAVPRRGHERIEPKTRMNNR